MRLTHAPIAPIPGHHREEDPGEAARLVPGYMVIGENDQPYRRWNLSTIFLANRSLGARWSIVTRSGATHSRCTCRDLFDPIFQTYVNLRLPSSMPTTSPPDLIVLPESNSWLGRNVTLEKGSWTCFGVSEPGHRCRVSFEKCDSLSTDSL